MASKGPLYFDTKTKKLVNKKPEEGILVISETAELSDAAREVLVAQYESVKAVADDADAARAKAQEEAKVETADAPAPSRTATTASVSGSKSKK